MSDESDELKTRIALLLEGTPVPKLPVTSDPASQPDRVAKISKPISEWTVGEITGELISRGCTVAINWGDPTPEISQETARELMAACIAARESLEYIEQLNLDVFERGWNEEIGQCDAAIARARAELGGKKDG